MADDLRPGDGNGKRVTITTSTLMPLGLVVALVLGLWRGTAYLDDRFNRLMDADRAIAEQLSLIKITLANRWTLSDMRLWESQLKINNPALVVPDSVSISRADAAIGFNDRTR